MNKQVLKSLLDSTSLARKAALSIKANTTTRDETLPKKLRLISKNLTAVTSTLAELPSRQMKKLPFSSDIVQIANTVISLQDGLTDMSLSKSDLQECISDLHTRLNATVTSINDELTDAVHREEEDVNIEAVCLATLVPTVDKPALKLASFSDLADHIDTAAAAIADTSEYDANEELAAKDALAEQRSIKEAIDAAKKLLSNTSQYKQTLINAQQADTPFVALRLPVTFVTDSTSGFVRQEDLNKIFKAKFLDGYPIIENQLILALNTEVLKVRAESPKFKNTKSTRQEEIEREAEQNKKDRGATRMSKQDKQERDERIAHLESVVEASKDNLFDAFLVKKSDLSIVKGPIVNPDAKKLARITDSERHAEKLEPFLDSIRAKYRSKLKAGYQVYAGRNLMVAATELLSILRKEMERTGSTDTKVVKKRWTGWTREDFLDEAVDIIRKKTHVNWHVVNKASEPVNGVKMTFYWLVHPTAWAALHSRAQGNFVLNNWSLAFK